MSELSSESDIIAEAVRIAAEQPGGTLATMHAEDGTPYVTFVFCHVDDQCRVVFGSRSSPQHFVNMEATPEVSFLVDNREVIRDDWKHFDRVVIEGRAAKVERGDPMYAELLEALRAKNPLAAQFSEEGELFCIHPRRLQVRKGVDPTRYVVDFGVTAR